ncbi:MAG: hypothetical protein ACE5JS_13300 [Nitrospinota bacterium]
MKTAKIFKAVALSALLLAGSAGAALAQDQLVSGVPYDGYLKGVTVPMNGPSSTDELVLEGPSQKITVERDSIRVRDFTPTEFAEAFDRLISG